MKKVTDIQKETLVRILGNRIKFENGGVNLTFGCTRADFNYAISSFEELNEEMYGKQNVMFHTMGIRIKVRKEGEYYLKISESTSEKWLNPDGPTKKVIHHSIEGCQIDISKEDYLTLNNW